MLKNLKKGKDGYNIASLITGTTISQAIPILASPILSRMFSPESFGVFGTVISIASVLTVASSLKYEMAIVLPSSEEKRVDIINLSFMVLFVFTFSSFFSILFAKNFFSMIIFGNNSYSNLLFFIPFLLFFGGAANIFKQWISSEKKFVDISVINIVSTFFANSFKIVSGFFSSHPALLLTGQTLGFFSGVVFFVHKYKIKIINIYRDASFKRIIPVAKEFKNFPYFSAPQNLLNSISHNIPTILLTSFFGLEIAGLFLMSRRIVFLPSTIIAESVKPVLYKKMADTFNSGRKINKQVVQSTAGLFLVILIPSTLIFVWGDELFSFFLGTNWSNAGRISRILLPLIITSFIKPPAYIVSNVIGRQKQMLVFESLLSIIAPFSIFIGYRIFEDPFISLLIFSVCFSIINLLIIFYFIMITMTQTGIKMK